MWRARGEVAAAELERGHVGDDRGTGGSRERRLELDARRDAAGDRSGRERREGLERRVLEPGSARKPAVLDSSLAATRHSGSASSRRPLPRSLRPESVSGPTVTPFQATSSPVSRPSASRAATGPLAASVSSARPCAAGARRASRPRVLRYEGCRPPIRSPRAKLERGRARASNSARAAEPCARSSPPSWSVSSPAGERSASVPSTRPWTSGVLPPRTVPSSEPSAAQRRCRRARVEACLVTRVEAHRARVDAARQARLQAVGETAASCVGPDVGLEVDTVGIAACGDACVEPARQGRAASCRAVRPRSRSAPFQSTSPGSAASFARVRVELSAEESAAPRPRAPRRPALRARLDLQRRRVHEPRACASTSPEPPHARPRDAARPRARGRDRDRAATHRPVCRRARDAGRSSQLSTSSSRSLDNRTRARAGPSASGAGRERGAAPRPRGGRCRSRRAPRRPRPRAAVSAGRRRSGDGSRRVDRSRAAAAGWMGPSAFAGAA